MSDVNELMMDVAYDITGGNALPPSETNTFILLNSEGECPEFPDPLDSCIAMAVFIAFSKKQKNKVCQALRSSAVYSNGRELMLEEETASGKPRIDIISQAAVAYARGRTLAGLNIASAVENVKLALLAADKKKLEPLTLDLFAMEVDRMGLTFRLNAVTHDTEFDGEGTHTDDGEQFQEDTITDNIYSELVSKYTRVNPDIVTSFTHSLADHRRFNPVLDYLSCLCWDKKPRIDSLIHDIMRIPAEDTLSNALIKCWLYQSIALLNATLRKPVATEGALALVGGQGIGKTSLCRALALFPKWFLEGKQINAEKKDDKRQSTSVWICEIGEGEATFKHDQAALKSFISNTVDVYRREYARSDERHPRRTSYIVTCNTNVFLTDQTGNRRWFTISMGDNVIPFSKIQSFDFEQMWAEVFETYNERVKDDPAFWRLTSDQKAQLNARNADHTVNIKSEQECRDIIDRAASEPAAFRWVYCTVSEWKAVDVDTAPEFKCLNRYTSEIIGKALSKIGILPTRKRIGNGNANVNCRRLPVPRGYYAFNGRPDAPDTPDAD